jgi:RimJ/RimL family protein N-acetyltransferase
MTSPDVTAVLSGQRRRHWAPDFPAAGDVAIAGLLERIGMPTGPDRLYAHRLITERTTGTVVGGIGFFGPPEQGHVEIAYGLVPSRRGRGYATEATRAMVAFALAQSQVREVVATVEPDNAPSIRVLERSGLLLHERRPALLVYRITSAG